MPGLTRPREIVGQILVAPPRVDVDGPLPRLWPHSSCTPLLWAISMWVRACPGQESPLQTSCRRSFRGPLSVSNAVIATQRRHWDVLHRT
jgi:hypothetical protein